MASHFSTIVFFGGTFEDRDRGTPQCKERKRRKGRAKEKDGRGKEKDGKGKERRQGSTYLWSGATF